MTARLFRRTLSFCLVLTLGLLLTASAEAAPKINKLSLRGLQAGGVTNLVIEGSDLLPEPRLLLTAPVARLTIREGATASRLEAEIALDGRTPSGIYLLRAASAGGISDPVAVGIDNLAQIEFAPQAAVSNVAMSGALSGSTVAGTTINGKKDQRVVIEVESRRLGANLNPTIHLYDARRKQLAWSQGLAHLAGDARIDTRLPADGVYTIELHDALYRGEEPGFFRLKIGDFHYASLVWPLAAQLGLQTTFQFAATDLPADTKAAATWNRPAGPPWNYQPAPWPADLPLLSGSRPVVMVTDSPEVVEAPAGDKLQEIPAAPVGINGRLEQPGQQDRFRLAVTPGQQLRFDVQARRAGSPLDGVLSIQNEQGAELAANDDRPGTSDPGLDFKVPDGTQALVVALRDLEGRGGPDFIYRISVAPIGVPDFTLSLKEDVFLVPKDGVFLARVRVERDGYNGPIKLEASNLPPSVSVTGDEIPAGATQALVTFSAPGLSAVQSVATMVGSSTEGGTVVRRPVITPRNTLNKLQPWLAGEIGMAVTGPNGLNLVWDLFSADTRLAQGTVLPIKLRVTRPDGQAGAVRLNLLTTQIAPRKKVKVNNVDREVPDTDRTIRFEGTPTIAAGQNEVDARILLPADLPQIAYDLAIEAELLAADNKKVVATVYTPARRLSTVAPIAIELASSAPIETRAGLGPTGSLKGKLRRVAGFTSPVSLSLTGLPKGVPAPSIAVAADQTDFDVPLSLPYGTPAGDLGVKLVGTSQLNPKDANSVVRSGEVSVALKVVPGEKPPVEKPLTVFEDQGEFVTSLDQGGGQASLFADEKYSGAASVKVTPDQKFNPMLPGLAVKIREKPGPGEYRYVQFAWKKQGGSAICLQLNHDGQWGPAEGKPNSFRYHAGPGGECFGASLAVDGNLPAGFTVVTRDLFADFGEFTLMGLALSPVDGEFALFDHIYLGNTPESFELVKPQ